MMPCVRTLSIVKGHRHAPRWWALRPIGSHAVFVLPSSHDIRRRMNEYHELVSHIEQLQAVLRATADQLHRDVIAGVSHYLTRRLAEVEAKATTGR